MTESAVAQVAALSLGESYAQAKFIPVSGVTPRRIHQTKQRLLSTMTSIVSRARKKTGIDYRIHSFHTYTQSYDTIVAAIIVRESDL